MADHLVMHIGAAKCGSKTLQRGVFALHPAILPITASAEGNPQAPLGKRLGAMIRRDDPDPGAEAAVAAEVAGHMRENEGVVYSAQGLTTNGGGSWRRKADAVERFARGALDRPVKIIFMFRAIEAYLWSSFRFKVLKHGGPVDYRAWLGRQIALARRGEATFQIGAILDRYRRIAGRDGVLFVWLEDMQRTPRQAYIRILEHCDVLVDEDVLAGATAARYNTTDTRLDLEDRPALRAAFESERAAARSDRETLRLIDEIAEIFDSELARLGIDGPATG